MTIKHQSTSLQLHPNILRRCVAIIYDLVLLTGILFLALIPVVIIVPESFRENSVGVLLTQIYILLIVFLFFGWFWTHQGQTLGMRAWRIKVITHRGDDLSWGIALKRFCVAGISIGACGIGLLWCLFDRQNLTLHDLYSGTKLVMVEKEHK